RSGRNRLGGSRSVVLRGKDAELDSAGRRGIFLSFEVVHAAPLADHLEYGRHRRGAGCASGFGLPGGRSENRTEGADLWLLARGSRDLEHGFRGGENRRRRRLVGDAPG